MASSGPWPHHSALGAPLKQTQWTYWIVDISDIAINIAFTLLFAWSLVWTFFVWGFGIHNFTRKHSKALGGIGMALWWALIAGHVVVIYAVWATPYSIWLLVGSLLSAHVFYGLTFARDVSTR